MVKVKVKYTIEKEIELELTTREWCELHSDKTSLVKQLAEESCVDADDIVVQGGYCDVIEGKLDYKNLDK